MPFMPWVDEYVTGIADIDERHRWMVDTMNRLHDELQKPQDPAKERGRAFFDLMDYAINYFMFEEALFEDYDYPQCKQHIAEHDIFHNKSIDLLSKYQNGKTVTDEVVVLVRDWLDDHFRVMDKSYVPYVLGKPKKKSA